MLDKFVRSFNKKCSFRHALYRRNRAKRRASVWLFNNSGDTRVIVRLKNFNTELIEDYPHPKVNF